jgi:hypothetical protein
LNMKKFCFFFCFTTRKLGIPKFDSLVNITIFGIYSTNTSFNIFHGLGDKKSLINWTIKGEKK